MNITEFVAKPAVTTLTVETPEILEAYGEPIEFYVKFPIPFEDYVTLTKLSRAEFVAKMLVDKEGNKLLDDGQTLAQFLIAPVNDKIWIEVGKLPEKCSIQNPKKST